MKISLKMRTWAKTFFTEPGERLREVVFKPPTLPPGVIPKEAKIAMDDAMGGVYGYANLCGFGEGFMGYPALIELTQRAEYRMLSEKTAQAMVRKWIKLTTKGEGDKSEKIAELMDELERYNVRELFAEAAKLDGFMGRAQLFIDMGEQEGPSLANPLIINKAAIQIGSLRKFKIVEPIYTSPSRYSSTNPLADDYYCPKAWYVMGKEIHSSRLLTFISRPVPDLLKPSYNFGGMSMSQLAKPYVDNWLQTRTSVSRVVRNYSTTILKTNMATVLMGDDNGDDLMGRLELFSGLSDNQKVMAIDMQQEEVVQVNKPLTDLDKLQAQSQEQMASVSNTPTPILLGITPMGLNASSDDEIRIYYDHVADMQMVLFKKPLHTVFQVIQLNKYGVIDPDIGFEFVPLWQLDTKEAGDLRKSDAEAAAIYVGIQALSPEDVRKKLAADPESGYTGIAEAVIELTPPDMEDDGEPATDPAGGKENEDD